MQQERSSDGERTANDTIAEIYGENELIGLVKIGNVDQPLILVPVEGLSPDVPPRVHTLWRLLRYVNKRIRHASCIDDMEGKAHAVSLPLKPEVLEILHRVISFIGVGRVRIKWILEGAMREGRVLTIPREPQTGG